MIPVWYLIHVGHFRGERLKELREKRGWTQQELATKVGASRNTINRLEIGNRTPSLALLICLAEVLGVKLDDLV